MELRRYLAVVRHRLPLIIVTVAVAIACGYLVTPRATRYTAAASIYVGPQGINLNPSANSLTYNYNLSVAQLISTWGLTIRSPSVVSTALGQSRVNRSAGQVADEISSYQIPNTYIMVVTVTDTDPPTAQALANSVSSAFIAYINQLTPGQSNSNNLTVQQQAALPLKPDSTGLIRNLLLSGVLGLVASLAVVSLLEYLDVTIRTGDDAERRLGLPVLGVVPSLGERLSGSPVLRVQESAPPARRGAPRTRVGTVNHG